MSYLWPIVTGVTVLDVWTLPHLFVWAVAASILNPLKAPKWASFSVCLLLALAWEVFEHQAFRRWPHIWECPESFLNSWVSVPLTCPAGFLTMWFLLGRYARGKHEN